jgi:steroid delta-isomerase-like uncharacterized protein
MNAQELRKLLEGSVDSLIKTQELREFVEKYVEALNALDHASIRRSHMDNSVSVSVRVTEQRMNPEELCTYQDEYHSAFPDARLTVENIIADPTHDCVAFQWVARGTHKGRFMGMEPTNIPLTVRGCSVLVIRNGKIVHETSYSDSASLMRQLGMLPADMPGGGKPKRGN